MGARPGQVRKPPNGSRLSCGASARGRKRPALRYELVGAQTSASSESRPRQLQALVRQHLPSDESGYRAGRRQSVAAPTNATTARSGQDTQEDDTQPAWASKRGGENPEYEREKAGRDRHTQDAPPGVTYGIGCLGLAALALVEGRVCSPRIGRAAESDDDTE